MPDTNVLLTRFLSRNCVAELSDFMAIGGPDKGQRLIRRAKAVRGILRFRMRCGPRFDYARAEHDLLQEGDTVVFRSRGADRLSLRLRATVPMRVADGEAFAEFELAPGASASFVLEDAAHGVGSAAASNYVTTTFKEASDYWRQWVARSTYRGRWRDVVNRSSLTLKLLTSAEHGAMVAAATFGLPEDIGGVRNWDYRYTWIRDAAFTVYAFLRLGQTEEANAFMRWLSDRETERGPDGSLRLMYGVDGHEELVEIELAHLRGYQASSPIRVGNAALEQLQLDIYGELMDAIYLSDKHGEHLSWRAWQGIIRSTN